MYVNVLANRKKPLDHDDWIMDSGGFTAISKHGKYVMTRKQYLECIQHHSPLYAFCQDWMCEDFMLKKTGLTIEEHQKRTTTNYLKLVWEDNRIRPVLQGWSGSDYCRHAEMYHKNGVEMNQLFGLGTVCSRNSKPEIVQKLVALSKTERSSGALKISISG